MFCGYDTLHYKLFDLDALGGALRHRRRALRAAGRHHQPERDVARQLDRDRDLGRGRRARHAVGADPRRGLVNGAKSFFTQAFPEYWLFVLGLLFILVTLFLPQGVVGPGRSSCEARSARMSDAAVRAPSDDAGDASARDRRPGELDTTHGVVLYLEDITVSFDGFKALNKLSLVDRRRRAALRHRPERRRQDHDDGRDHRQDAARQRHACSSARPSTSRG